jgi:integrase
MERYYISSNKYSLQEHKNSKGKTVYDLVFGVVTLDGQRKQKWIRGFANKTLAKEAYLDFVQKHCELRRYTKQKNPEKEKLLVGDLMQQYMSTLGNQNKQSVIYDKDNIFRKFILPKYNTIPIDNLTKEEMYKWQDELWATRNQRTGEYFSHKYLTKIRGHFSTFLTWVERRYGYKNNLIDVTRPKRRQPKKEMQIWTREQFEQFIAVVDDATYHALFTFMFFTGRRKGELFALYKTDVKADSITINKSVNRRQFGTGTWEITSTKADKTSTVPVCKVVQEEIKRYKPPKNGKFYFGGEQPLALSTVDRKFKKYTELAGLPNIRIHDLRHSFVSLLVNSGANFLIVADLIDDTVEMVTKTYAHLYVESKLDVLDKIR